jgi:hypothetical protein
MRVSHCVQTRHARIASLLLSCCGVYNLSKTRLWLPDAVSSSSSGFARPDDTALSAQRCSIWFILDDATTKPLSLSAVVTALSVACRAAPRPTVHSSTDDSMVAAAKSGRRDPVITVRDACTHERVHVGSGSAPVYRTNLGGTLQPVVDSS